MKLIIVIIKPENLEKVKEELYKREIKSMTVMDVQGHGRQMGHTEVYRGREYAVDFLNKIQLEIAVPDDMEDVVIEAILTGGKSAGGGSIGDGKIFVTDIKRAIRIRTEEEGDNAL